MTSTSIEFTLDSWRTKRNRSGMSIFFREHHVGQECSRDGMDLYGLLLPCSRAEHVIVPFPDREGRFYNSRSLEQVVL